MKKLIFSVLSLTVLTFTAANAQEPAKTENTAVAVKTVGKNEKTELKSADLPAPVKEALAGPEYKGWELGEKAYLVKNEADKSDFYEVVLKNTATSEAKIVKLDKGGKSVQ